MIDTRRRHVRRSSGQPARSRRDPAASGAGSRTSTSIAARARGSSPATASATSTTARGSASPTPGTPTRGSPRRSRRRPRSCSTASRTSCTTSRACGCTTGCRTSCPAARGRRSCRTRAPRPSRRRSSWRGSRPAARSIIAFRYGYHGRTAQTMALTTAKDVYRGAFEPLPGLRLPHRLSVLLPRGRRRRTTRRPARATGRSSST